MDPGIIAGIGVALITWLLGYVIKDIPAVISWMGIAAGLALVIWSLSPIPSRFNGPVLLFFIAAILAAGATGWAISLRQASTDKPISGAVSEKSAASADVPSAHADAAPPKPTDSDKTLPNLSPTQSAPIQWLFNDDSSFIFGPNQAKDGTYLVGTFNIRGRNISNEPITKVDAYLIPQILATPLPLKFYDPHEVDLVDTKDAFIEPQAEFQLSYKIPTYDKDQSLQGVPVDLFLSKYGGVKFVFNYNGNTSFNYEFSFSQIRVYLLREKERHDESKKSPPGIKRIPN